MSGCTINIVAGGPSEFIPLLNDYDDEEILWIGVDRGTIYLLDHKIIPHTAVGDFDSITEAEWENAQFHVKHIEKFRSEKDETDMTLALNWALTQKPSKIQIFGATGGRLDHLFTNALMLVPIKQQYPQLEFLVIDRQNELSILLPGNYEIHKDVTKKYLSLIPLSETVENICLNGFKYPLHNQMITFGSSLCVSNEFIADIGTISFTKGIIMMVRSED